MGFIHAILFGVGSHGLISLAGSDQKLDMATKNLAHSANATGLSIRNVIIIPTLPPLPLLRCVVAPLREKKIFARLHNQAGTARKKKEGLTQRRNVKSKTLIL